MKPVKLPLSTKNYQTVHMDLFDNPTTPGAFAAETVLKHIPRTKKDVNAGKDIIIFTIAENGSYTTAWQFGTWERNRWQEAPGAVMLNLFQHPAARKITLNKTVDHHLADITSLIEKEKLNVLPNPDL